MSDSPPPSAHVDTFCRDGLPTAREWPELVFDLPELQYPERLNCAVELLDKVIERLGADRPCLVAPGSPVWTYGDLLRVSNQIANVLVHDYAIVPGNRVMLRGPNTQWLVACWIGVIKAGAVAVTTAAMLRSVELTKIAEIANVDLVLCDARFTDSLIEADIPRLHVVEYGGSAGLTKAIAGKSAEFIAVDTAAVDVALLAFTSGTTGRPKATVHFHRDVLAIADSFSTHILKPKPTDVFTGTPPLAFTFGLGGLVVFPLRVGASTLLLEKASPEQLAEFIADYNVTVCITAPTAYRAIVNSGKVDRLSRLRRAVSAGEHLPVTTWQSIFAATGLRIIDGVGATEMLHIFIASAEDEIRPGSTGRVVPGYVAAVLDEHGVPLPPGIPGRLAVKGPTGCRYLSDSRQCEYVQAGWNITGDIFVQDVDGYFWYQARSDDMIVSSGYNIAAPEVEQALMAHPDVEECGVVGLSDDHRGQLVSAFIVLRSGIEPHAGRTLALQDFVKSRIAPYKYPRQIFFVDELPKTGTGKLQRHRLPELVSGLRLEPDAP
ncbi:AMP-binding protein [Mycolicibacterium holsaticum]|uniref:2-aminobenzoate-CoA ligase n=1 Tax=Mycolicibacterium holsaticum TaxID=152142 RepID=A0A1E3RWS0_9MYCO|nr:AMP-binding protein [Mycolicibacterium holsaticum]ODQ94309.1 2-aminobenzoate-CoA ligase [Mycolicibacterium holsaticum]